jgi:uncharacterized damage-inducible protein DinB
MTPRDLQRLIAFHRWATELLLDAAAPLTAEQLARPLGGSFGSLLATLQHMVGADWVWLERFHGRSPRSFEGVDALATIGQIHSRWTDVIDGLAAVAAGLTEAGAAREIHFTSFRGDPFRQPIGVLLQHVVNHGTYHRGQVAMSLRLLGLAAPSTDLVVFERTHPLSHT